MPSLSSIVIPCYNAEKWIGQAIESALGQTWPSKEIIVVNDGSTDASLNVARRFESKSVKVVSQENRGNGAARNRALKEAQGEFVQYLDADDLLHPGKLHVQIERLEREMNGAIASGAWGQFNRSPDEAVFKPDALWKDFSPIEWLITNWREKLMMHPAAWLAPRTIIDAAGPWNEKLLKNVDGEYFTRVILTSSRIVFCPDAQSYYRADIPSSVSRNSTLAAQSSLLRSLEMSAEELLKKESSLRTRLAAAQLFQHFVYDNYPQFIGLSNTAAEKVAKLGGCKVAPVGGRAFSTISRILGWKAARRLQIIYRRMR